MFFIEGVGKSGDTLEFYYYQLPIKKEELFIMNSGYKKKEYKKNDK